jgi:hypothetical protein
MHGMYFPPLGCLSSSFTLSSTRRSCSLTTSIHAFTGQVITFVILLPPPSFQPRLLRSRYFPSARLYHKALPPHSLLAFLASSITKINNINFPTFAGFCFLIHTYAKHFIHFAFGIIAIMLFTALAVAAAVGSAVAQRPANTSICDFYTTALLKNNTAANQMTLLTLVVNTAIIGNCRSTSTPYHLDILMARQQTQLPTSVSAFQASSLRACSMAQKSSLLHTSAVLLPLPTGVVHREFLLTSLMAVLLLLLRRICPPTTRALLSCKSHLSTHLVNII